MGRLRVDYNFNRDSIEHERILKRLSTSRSELEVTARVPYNDTFMYMIDTKMIDCTDFRRLYIWLTESECLKPTLYNMPFGERLKETVKEFNRNLLSNSNASTDDDDDVLDSVYFYLYNETTNTYLESCLETWSASVTSHPNPEYIRWRIFREQNLGEFIIKSEALMLPYDKSFDKKFFMFKINDDIFIGYKHTDNKTYALDAYLAFHNLDEIKKDQVNPSLKWIVKYD